MPATSFLDAPIPPQLDLAAAPSQLFQVPPTPSASHALYRSIIPARKRSRPEVETRHWRDNSVPSRIPILVAPDDLPGAEISADFDYRPSRYRNPPRPRPLDDSVESLGDATGIRRKRSRRDPSLIDASPVGVEEKITTTTTTTTTLYPQPAAPVRWSQTVLGVVGKVWDFCWGGAFRGFYAGGGQGYTMTAEEASVQLPSTEKETVHFTPTLHPHKEGPTTPLPGQYPEEEDLNRSWVMVSHREEFDESSPSNRRRLHPRRSPHAHSHGHTRRRPQGKRTLMSNASSIPTKSQFSSPAKPRESPVSVETQRYMAQKRRMEREEDASLRRLNRQLQSMIKEGKQALGTRVEVDDLEMED
ncbi:hypothetical protein BO70DRAFT_364452 [Aspergillus heteromorphus CBS 117.55]|uniref:Uncharacterized protein n=1 Tax=Aspergillus heteromorphus CBS 117.55 TaxID=1448321 RepID=A0A317VGR6_9EURO|nr:uncharacterized protein BO70DRAFT_364452 [Aspergillus heteromorphus CBS 117.55]PWY73563.1 hypothetical protein BO70DRAFT_364452 [Aspergillus heteromorphus CBS 117.55]